MSTKRSKDVKDVHDLDVSISKDDFLDMANRLTKIENEMKKMLKNAEIERKKDKEEKDSLRAEMGKMNLEKDLLKEDIKVIKLEKESLKVEMEKIKVENSNLKKQIIGLEHSKEENEKSSLENIKEQIERVKTEVKNDMEKEKTGWVDIVKRNIKNEIIKEDHIVHTTLEEEKMRQGRRLNVRVVGLKEGASPEEDAKGLGKMLGYVDTLPITKVWRVGRDITRKRALVLQFKDLDSKTYFLKKKVILRGLGGDPIYLDDDLTKMQIEHRKTCMPRILQARKEGHRAFYRDGRVIINGRTMD